MRIVDPKGKQSEQCFDELRTGGSGTCWWDGMRQASERVGDSCHQRRSTDAGMRGTVIEDGRAALARVRGLTSPRKSRGCAAPAPSALPARIGGSARRHQHLMRVLSVWTRRSCRSAEEDAMTNWH